MKRKLGMILPILAVGILTVGYLLNQKSSGSNSANNGEALYSHLTDLNKTKTNHFDLAEVKGQYFLLHFWAKWCEPCADEIPVLVNFAKTAKLAKPLKIIAVSLDPSMDEAKQILPQQGVGLPANFILYLDPEHKVAEEMGSYQYPETYFVGPDGVIIEKWIGAQKWEKPEVVEFFNHRMQ